MEQLLIDRSTFKRGATITSRHLRAMFACDNQIRKFRREWPDGVRLIRRNLMRAAEIGLDICWLVEELKLMKLITTSDVYWFRMRYALDEWEEAEKGQKRISQRAYYRAGAEVLWRAIRDG